jgi:aspartate-semialdehyde dehydrogenase
MVNSRNVIAIVGATGLVGQEMMTCLESSNVKVDELRLFASKDSVGEVYKFRGDEAVVRELAAGAFAGVTHALFATSAALSAEFVPVAVEAGAITIDNSSHFRMEAGVPLVVPEVNPKAIGSSRVIANPNCSTIQLVPVLQALHEIGELKRVVVSSYQSVSGAGKEALDELWSQTLAIFNQRDFTPEAFAHQIAFNCIPQIDVVRDDGYTKEEFKIINESRKILNQPDLKITATAVRVPVLHSHAESVNIEFAREVTVNAAVKALSNRPGIQVYPEWTDYPMQLGVTGTDEIHVGRIRRDESVEFGLNLWVVADNLRKGAALNAVQILELLVNKES